MWHLQLALLVHGLYGGSAPVGDFLGELSVLILVLDDIPGITRRGGIPDDPLLDYSRQFLIKFAPPQYGRLE